MPESLVIARGYRGEPLKRVAICAENGLIYVANPDYVYAVKAGDSFPVGFPPEDVFVFEKAAFLALRAAWGLTQQEPPPAMWHPLRRFQPNEEAAN